MSNKRKIGFDEYSEIFKIEKKLKQAADVFISRLKKTKNKLPIAKQQLRLSKDYNIIINVFPNLKYKRNDKENSESKRKIRKQK